MRAATGTAAATLLLAAACATSPPTPGDDGRAARLALERFTSAVEAGRWGDAYAGLSSPWRARETPARLADDLSAAGAAGRDALRRVRALLAAGAPLVVRGDVATLAVGEGREARLVREAEGWRVDALE